MRRDLRKESIEYFLLKKLSTFKVLSKTRTCKIRKNCVLQQLLIQFVNLIRELYRATFCMPISPDIQLSIFRYRIRAGYQDKPIYIFTYPTNRISGTALIINESIFQQVTSVQQSTTWIVHGNIPQAFKQRVNKLIIQSLVMTDS